MGAGGAGGAGRRAGALKITVSFCSILYRSLSNYMDKVNIYMSYFVFEDNHFLRLF